MWIARDAFGLYRRRVVAILLMNIVGVLSASASLGGLYLYVRHLESREPLSVRGLVLPVSDELWAVASLAGALIALGLVSSASLYATEVLVSRLALAYRDRCQHRALSVAADPLTRGWQGLVDGPARAALTELSRAKALHMALALHFMLHGLLPIAIALIAFGTLLATDLVLTLVLLPAVLAYLLPLRAINRAVSRATEGFESYDRKARSTMARGIEALVDGSAPAEEKRAVADALARDPDWGQAGRHFYLRRLADDRLQLVNSVFTIVSTAAIVVFFAATRGPNASWTSLLVYVVALRFAISSSRQVSMMFVQLSRLHPIYGGYCSFMTAVERLRATRGRGGHAAAAVPGRLSFRCSGTWDAELGDSVHVQRGQALVVLVPREPTHADLERAATVLEWHAAEAPDMVSAGRFRAAEATGGAEPTGARTPYLFLSRTAFEAGAASSEHADYLFVVGNRPGLLDEAAGAALRERLAAVVVVDGGRLVNCGGQHDLPARRGALREFLALRRAAAEACAGAGAADDDLDDAGEA